MTIQVLVNGANGKMGQETVKAIEAAKTLTLVGKTDNAAEFKQQLESVKPNVVVDFTTSHSVYENTKLIIEHNIHPVIGTSGLLQAEIDELTILCQEKKLGGIIVPNFSIGAVLMMQMSKMAAKFLPTAEIIEYHHPKKQDAPSGTAVKTAELIAASRQDAPAEVLSEEIIPGARGANLKDIPIHAVRLPGMLAHQSVLFGGQDEMLTIRHDSSDRKCFMPGVILAVSAVIQQETLLYGLEHVLLEQ